jgi:hypothetical protein
MRGIIILGAATSLVWGCEPSLATGGKQYDLTQPSTIQSVDIGRASPQVIPGSYVAFGIKPHVTDYRQVAALRPH